MVKVEEIYELFKQSTGVCTDTRKIEKKCLFFALKGANFDGNLFANKALEQGAYKVIVDDSKVIDNEDYILVEDVLSTLQELSIYHRRQLNIPIVAITGSNGKTTTKELINAVLNKRYKAFATAGNFNNHIGVPLTLLSIDKSIEIAVVEMGANHPKEIDFLCNIAEPDIGLVTNVGKAHLEGFGSFEGVKRTKGELYRYIENKSGLLFVNKSNEYLLEMLGEGAELFYYGKTDDCKVQLLKLRNTPILSFYCKVDDKEVEVNSHLIGSYNLENVLAAVSVGNYFGVSGEKIVEAINEYIPDNNRSQLVVTKNNKVLFDAYNANPTSMKAALENFVSLQERNKVVILGEMKELGSVSDQEHIEILSFLRRQNSLKVYLIGENYKDLIKEEDGFNWLQDVNGLISHLTEETIVNSFVLVKGSRSNQLEKLKGVI